MLSSFLRPNRTIRPVALALVMATAACVQTTEATTPDVMPVMAWDHRPEATEWTQATLDALRAEGAVLASTLPADVETYCPNYAEASPDERRMFWAGLFSAIAKFESTWNPTATGGGGAYFGLLQISPRTADYVGCDGDLHDGANNLQCAVKIAARQADPTEAEQVWQITRDWGPMHHADKRAAVAEFTRAQSYCN